jgi:uncharacterized membrane protein
MNGQQPRPSLSLPASIKTLLFASIALNLFFAGWLVGARMVPWGFGPPPGPRQQFSDHLRSTLSPEGFAAMNRLFHDLEGSRHQEFESTAPLRDRIKQTLTAEPFDRAAFARGLADLNSEIGRQRSELDSTVIDAVASLTAEDRRRLAEVPLPPPPRPPGGGFGANLLPADPPLRP